MKRKEDLLALDKGKNIENCLNLLCSDLRRLSEVEGWWKIDENKAHEKRVAGLIAAISQQSLHALNNDLQDASQRKRETNQFPTISTKINTDVQHTSFCD
ncbi:uncharacterized protein [Pocillopora verrucosa]|uniref:uncharacterized protein isoform X3 n=1 Tax=Pocillopora verrucosa TaxID=203993 RepID=UPI00333F94A9